MLDTWPKQRSWNLSIRNRSGSSFRALRISQLQVQLLTKPSVKIVVKAWNFPQSFDIYTMKFFFRCGAILDLTCYDLERSMTLDDWIIPISVKYYNYNSIFGNIT